MKVYCNCCGNLISASMEHKKLSGNIEVCSNCFKDICEIENGTMSINQIDLSRASERMLKWVKDNGIENNANSNNNKPNTSVMSKYEKLNAENIQNMAMDIHVIKNVVLCYVILSVIGALILILGLL